MSSFTIEDIPEKGSIPEKCGKALQLYTYYNFIRVKPSNCVLPSIFEGTIDTIQNFEVRDDDVFLISNPKCGTTWSMETVWLIANNLDYEAAKESQFTRFPHFDADGCIGPEIIEHHMNGVTVVDTLQKQTTPRFMKSHLPKELLPTQIWTKKPKIIFVLRNPKDAAISNFHHYRVFHQYTGTLEEFLEATIRDEVMYSPFWQQVIPFWQMRNEANVLFLRYEDMKSDFGAVIRRIADFFGKSYTDEQVEGLKDYLSVANMKKNSAVNYEDIKKTLNDNGVTTTEGSFIREGQSGGWEKVMSPEMVAKFDEWTKRQITGTGLEEFYG